MNICNELNKILCMIYYSLYGETKEYPYDSDISLPKAMLIVLISIVWLLIIFWWLAPIQFLVNKLHLRDIKFKCDN